MANDQKYNYLLVKAADSLKLKILIISMAFLTNACTIAVASPNKEVSAKTSMTGVKENKKIVADIQSTEINPHWDVAMCGACHISEAKKGNPELRAKDDRELCMRCHSEDVVHKYIHPAGIDIPKDYSKRIAKNWKNALHLDSNKRLTCTTCHDPLNQCLKGRSYMSKVNINFLREGPYSKRTEICYKCHDASKYKKMIAHDQIGKDGFLKLNKCRLCHKIKNSKKIVSGIDRDLEKFPLISNLNEERTQLCIRCHKKIDHPTSAFRVASVNTYRHLITITDEKRKTLDRMKAKTGIFMPLEPDTDRIYCGTCHEAHQPGVFAGEAKTSLNGTKNRLRANMICTYCHDK
jgi:predicted CXXCH cytochrome family protein